MDPWHPHPWDEDRRLFPDIDEINSAMIDRIVTYLPLVRHAVVSLPTEFQVHPKLAHLENMRNQVRRVQDYMNERDLKDIVYLGFHHGHCIITKPDGAGTMRRWYRCWLKRDLACDWPGSQIEVADKTSRYFMTWI